MVQMPQLMENNLLESTPVWYARNPYASPVGVGARLMYMFTWHDGNYRLRANINVSTAQTLIDI